MARSDWQLLLRRPGYFDGKGITQVSCYDDPTAHCFVAGVPRSIYTPSPLHILQPPGYVVILHERMSYRVIPLGKKHTLPDHVRLWMGVHVSIL